MGSIPCEDPEAMAGESQDAADLAVIIVSANSKHWLGQCLSSVHDRRGDLRLDVVVVDCASTDGTRDFIEEYYPSARVISVENRGFAAGNNAALGSTVAPFVLFLNPDTEVVEGQLGELVARLADRPGVGLVGVKQIDSKGGLLLTIRRFPSVTRTLFEALGSERWPFRATWLGERELDHERYSSEVRCDWTVGSFMLARREAIDASGFMDERFFLYREEPDLCWRMRQAGWETRHLPSMTIVHHGGEREPNVALASQEALSRRLYMWKHFSWPRRIGGVGALASGYALRVILGRRSVPGGGRRASLRALVTVLGMGKPPFGRPPRTAVAPRSWRHPS